jgi:membrane protein
MYLYGEAGGGVLSSGLAARALFALLPGLLLAIAAVGFVVRDPATFGRLVDVISRFAPPLHDLLGDSLEVISEGALQVTVVGVILLVWTAAGFFQSLDEVFAVVLDERKRRGTLARVVLGLAGTLLVLGAVVVGAIAGALLWNAAAELLTLADPALPTVLVMVVLAVVVAAGVGAAYRLVPTRRPSWNSIGLPALVVGVVVALLTQVFTLIAPRLAGVASLYGGIAAVFVLLAWLQLATQVVVIGVVWVGVRAFGAPPPSALPWPTGDVGRPDAPGAPPDAVAPNEPTGTSHPASD